jgi:hypothetical protein
MCLQKNFQRVLVIDFGNDYSECCKDVLDILNEDEDAANPTMLLTTPSQCAALLRQYLSIEIEKAGNPSSTNTWERHSHSKFCSQEGTFNKVKVRKAIKPETPVMVLRGTWWTSGQKVGVGKGASLDYNEGKTKPACLQRKVS